MRFWPEAVKGSNMIVISPGDAPVRETGVHLRFRDEIGAWSRDAHRAPPFAGFFD
jgi:hypothetical protein